jgi:hypothetical protein
LQDAVFCFNADTCPGYRTQQGNYRPLDHGYTQNNKATKIRQHWPAGRVQEAIRITVSIPEKKKKTNKKN